MKKTIKKVLSVLTLLVLLITFSCTEDLYQEKTQTNENHEFIIKKVNFNEISSNKKLVEKLGKLNSKKEATVNPEGKIVYSSEYGFYVDTDYANYIEDKNGKHSYIFKVYRDSVQNKLDNIVFSLQEDNSYKVVLISYDLTSLEQQNLERGISINVSDNPRTAYLIEDENLASNIFSKTLMVYEGNGCITIMEVSCSCNVHDDSTGYSNCNSSCYTETVWWTNCGGSGGGGGGTTGGYNNPTGNTGSTTGSSGNDGTGTNSGGTSGTGSNNNNQNPIYTTPTYPSPQQILKDKFIKQLSGGF